MKILCVDDDEGLLYLLCSALEKLAYQVMTCRDSQTVFATLQANTFDAVILDQEMPNLNGLEVIKQCKTLETVPPIIMVTGAGNEAIAVEAMRLGASDYVVKDTQLGYLKIMPSVIQQVIYERQLRQQQRAAEQLAQVEKERSRLLNQFILDASHEFRIPLTIIRSSAELLGRLITEPKPQTYVKQILHQSDRIVNLVDHLIQLTKFENTTHLTLEACNLVEIIHNATQRSQRALAEKELKLTLKFPDDPVTVNAQPYELGTAFLELLTNAYNASSPGGEVVIGLALNALSVIVTICDHGVGMTDEQLTHIFERFYRVDEAHSTPGFGLGLPIVELILALHSGSIHITSELGKGTTATVVLPRCLP